MNSIWRSLPLFAVLIGFAGASLNFLAAAAPTPDRGAWAWVIYLLILLNVGFYGWGVRHLMTTVLPRRHRYIANDRTVRKFGLDLLNFHLAAGLSEQQADLGAAADVKRYLIDELAEASSEIQALNRTKAYARAQALFWLSLGFIFWFLVSSAILIEQKFIGSGVATNGPERHSTDEASRPESVDGSGATNAAAPAIRGGGGRPAISAVAISPTGPPKGEAVRQKRRDIEREVSGNVQ